MTRIDYNRLQHSCHNQKVKESSSKLAHGASFRKALEGEKEEASARQSLFDLAAEEGNGNSGKRQKRAAEEAVCCSALSMPLLVQSIQLSQTTSQSITALESLIPILVESTQSGITHLTDRGMKETWITLDGTRFTDTALEGVKLVIREFSTAPLAYNVELRCSPTSLAHLQSLLPSLTAAIQQEHHSFVIHKIDAYLHDSPPPLIHRKESAADEDKPHDHDQRG